MQATGFYATAAVADDDAFHTGITTGAAVTKTQADFNGALAVAFVASQLPAQTLSLTTSAGSGNWSTTLPIVVTGTYGGATVRESFQPTVANGAEVLSGSQPFDPGTMSIAIPLEPGAGTLKVGVRDICSPKNRPIIAVKALAAGNVAVKTQRGLSHTLAMLSHEVEEVPIDRVLAATAVGVIVYF